MKDDREGERERTSTTEEQSYDNSSPIVTTEARRLALTSTTDCSTHYLSHLQVLAMLVSGAAIAYLCRHPLGAAESTIRRDLALSEVQSGALMGTFFWTYALFQIPGGWMGHTVGNRFALIAFMLMNSLAMFLFAVSPTFIFLLVSQAILGMAQAGMFPCAALAIRRWFPLNRRALSFGCLGAGMQLGIVTTAFSTGWLLTREVTWRWLFVLYGLPGLMWAAWFAASFHELPVQSVNSRKNITSHLLDKYHESTTVASDKSTPWRIIFTHRTSWFMCGQQILRSSGYMFFAAWFPTYIQVTRGVDIANAGAMQAIVLAAKLLGGPIGGWFADWVLVRSGMPSLSRRLIGGGGQLLCAALVLSAYFADSIEYGVGLLALGAFFTTVGGTVALSLPADIGGNHVGQLFGVMNMCGNFAAGACPIVIGWIFATTNNWNIVLLLFASVYAAAACCWLFIEPTVDVTKPKNNVRS